MPQPRDINPDRLYTFTRDGDTKYPYLSNSGCDAPPVPPESISRYGLKAASDAIADLAQQLQIPKIILGGHDWGGLVVYRCAQYHPELVSHIISICTPYVPPSLQFVSLEELAKRAPFFGYQLQLAGNEVEDVVKGEEKIRQFLKGVYGARTPDKNFLFDAQKGLDLDVLPRLGRSPLLSDQELDYYVQEYCRHSNIHGTLNWYRTRRVNHADESSILSSYSPSSGALRLIDKPTLFIAGAKDPVLLPVLSEGMDRFWGTDESGRSLLSKKQVNAGHWALWEDAEGVNRELEDWLLGPVLGSSGVDKETGSVSKDGHLNKGKI
ncbi:MAG: hypothetical protein M1831_005093 [Alyxoria varia]|nr:MAG: hypothetical protein M1831_005093 [Alyxoria varia]